MVEVRAGGGIATACTRAHSAAYRSMSMQVFTGTIPFSHLGITYEVVKEPVVGMRPSRPTHPALTEPLWELMQRCWDKEPLVRPEAAEISRILRASSVPHPFL